MDINVAESRKVPVDILNPASYNPRKDLQPGDPEYEALKKSLGRWGLVQDIVWNEATGNVVGGHQRLKVLIAAGAKELEVKVVNLSDADEKALNIALNRVDGAWDDEKLEALLRELKESEELDDLSLTGFEDIDYANLLNDVTENDTSGKYRDTNGDRVAQETMSHTKKHEIINVDVSAYDYYIISFSGGKDSTLLALWALENLPHEKLLMLYWDSGWNYPEETEYVNYFVKKYKIQTIIVGEVNNTLFREKVKEKGYPFYGFLWCQSELKIKSLSEAKKYIAKKYSPKILSLNGIRQAESKKRSDYPEFSRSCAETFWYPVVEWTDEDLIKYMAAAGEKLCVSYNYNNRLGCAFCPNANSLEMQYLKTHHPKILAEINECFVDALNDPKWRPRFEDTFKLFNKVQRPSEGPMFTDIAFSEEEWAEMRGNGAFEPDYNYIIDLREKRTPDGPAVEDLLEELKNEEYQETDPLADLLDAE